MDQIKIEFYPDVYVSTQQNMEKEIEQNIPHWNKPFFMEPRKHFNKQEIEDTCKSFIEKGIEHIIVIGTGGSIQTMKALIPFASRNVHTVTSSRPRELKKVLSIPGIKSKSVVIPISRGGKTLDVNSTLYLFEGWNMIGLSSRGPMNEILKKFNCPILDVPDLSGRFAASCTNVALLPAFAAGIDIDSFVSGLEFGYSICGLNYDVQDNIAKQFAIYLKLLFDRGYRNIFNMPYFSWLTGSVGLFVQEVSESTGKDNKGMLCTAQEAPLCQHSVLEFLLGGTKGHTLPIIWTIENILEDLDLRSKIPHVQGKTAGQTVNYQANATFEALLTKSVPSAMIVLSEPTVKNIGMLIAFIQSTVYYLCMLFDVNWESNPNVLIGKQICNEAMNENKSWDEMRETRKKIAKEKFKPL
ncbi:MAG: hypothetical protein ACTSWN_16905 [Promethearchaeota archaeon]